MRLISFLFIQCKTAFNVNTYHVISNIAQLVPLFDVDHLEIANCFNLTIVFYPFANFGQTLCIRSRHGDQILTRKSHNCAGIALIQGTSAGGSKFIQQTLQYSMNWKSSMQCSPYCQKIFETPCIKLMIVSKKSN